MDTARRMLLAGLGLAALAPSASATVRREKLLLVYLRGGADALSLVPPTEDADYQQQRPRTRLYGKGKAPEGRTEAEPLSAGFGIHPALNWVKARHDAGRAAIVLATGAPGQSRSHFAMQAATERADWGVLPQRMGFLARYLERDAAAQPRPFRGVALGRALPVSLQGGLEAVPVSSLDDLQLPDGSMDSRALSDSLAAHYGYGDGGAGDSLLERQAATLLAGMSAADALRRGADSSMVSYPDGIFAQQLALGARLIRQDGISGTEVLTADLGGWDTHDRALARIASLAAELDQGLAAFYADLGARAGDVTTVIMSEFGRRIAENNSLGADHGSGGLMIVIGSAIRGGVYDGRWPGLQPQRYRGDIEPTVDYRDVLADVLCGPLGMSEAALAEVFPGLQRQSLDLAEAAG